LASYVFAAKRTSLTEAESHRLKAVAEKLKVSEEAALLLDKTGITIGQGYLFLRPELVRSLLQPRATLSSAASRASRLTSVERKGKNDVLSQLILLPRRR